MLGPESGDGVVSVSEAWFLHLAFAVPAEQDFGNDMFDVSFRC
jgi:hypothetical protein